MIKIQNKDVVSMYINGQAIIAVYTQGQLVWPNNTVLSCYYNGYWIDDYPWTDDTPWTD